MRYEEEAQRVLNSMGYEDWHVLCESTLETPNGHVIEWDGESEDGEVSPFITLGFI